MFKVAGYDIGHNLVEYEPLNSALAYAVGRQDALTQWTAKELTVKKKHFKIVTIENRRIKPHMFYYATVKGYYELFDSFGVYFSSYTKDEYLARKDRHEFLSIVSLGKRLQFGCFHSGLSAKKLAAMAMETANERDAQRSRLYKWHYGFIRYFPELGKLLNPRAAEELVKHVLSDYSVDLDRIDFLPWNDRNKKAVAKHHTVYESKLDPANFCKMYYQFGNTALATVLHEIGHSLTNTEYSGWVGNYVAGHGPEYCLIYAELVARYGGIPFDIVYESMLAHKLKIAPKHDYFDGKEYVGYDSL